MKIAVGMFYHEANSFNPSKLQKEDMVYFEGEEVLKRVYATEIFKNKGVELVPLIYAVALPNGIVDRQAYDYFSDRIISVLQSNQDVDAVFLHLHGSMEVDGLGSGEYFLIERIRKLLGSDVIIGLTLDFHANTDERLPLLVNVIRNYRTVPHRDQEETEHIVARTMLEFLDKSIAPIPQFIRLPYAIHPEKALSSTWPLKEIFNRLEEYEKLEGIAIASLGCGMVWCDCATLATNVIVTPSKPEFTQKAKNIAKEIADYVYSLRDSFEYEQLPLFPHDAAKYAVEFKYDSPVFISDSGDNTTGGAVGDHTIMLREFLSIRDLKGKKILVTSIWDEKCVNECWEHSIGDVFEVSVGKNYDENTKAVKIKGILKSKGSLLGYMGCEKDPVGRCVTLSVGQIDLCIIDRPGSFISKGHFGSMGAGLNIEDYDIIVVKQGYLFVELRTIAKLAIIALTPGATHQILEALEFKKIKPPVYPLRYKGN